MSWMSPVQVRLGMNNPQLKEISHEVTTTTSGNAIATMTGSTPSQLASSPLNGASNGESSEVAILEYEAVIGS